MRWISLPDELSLSHLLDVRDVAQPNRDVLTTSGQRLREGRPDLALSISGRAFGQAKHLRDRYGQALALLCQAEAYRCLGRWEEGLDAIRTALHWLELQVAAVAHYNEAIAVYVEGVIHFTLGARDRMVETFAYAQHVLGESERHWSYEHNDARSSDCRNVVRWIRDLQDIQETLPSSGLTAVVPAYAVAEGRLVRTGAVVLESVRATLPAEVLSRYLPLDLRPVQSGDCSFPYLNPASRYVAIQAATRQTAAGTQGEEILVVIERASTGSIVGERFALDAGMWVACGDGAGVPLDRLKDPGIPRAVIQRGRVDE